jgi:hypothetical protein
MATTPSRYLFERDRRSLADGIGDKRSRWRCDKKMDKKQLGEK